MRATLRRWRNPAWRYAHRSEFPSREQLLAGLLAAIVLGVSPWIAHTSDFQAELADAISSSRRIERCLNGQTTLGGETIERDGSRWVVTCSWTRRRVAG